MSTLNTTMLWVFWVSLIVIILIDIVLAISARKTFSRQARNFGMDVPVIAYAAGLLPTHFWLNHPIIGGWLGALFVVGGALIVLGWEIETGSPMHPFLAFIIGLPMGAMFFVN